MKVGFNKVRHSLVLSALGAVLAAAFACGDRAAGYLNEARRYERDYDYEHAAARYELVAVGFKRSPWAAEAQVGRERCRGEAHFDRAEGLIFDGAAAVALADIAAGRALAPYSPRGLHLAGLAHLFIGPRDVALQEFNACIIRYPASPYGYLGRAEYYRFQQQRDVALVEFTRAFRVAGRDARARAAAFRGLRDMAEKLGSPDGTFAAWEREATSAVGADAFHYWLGYYYMQKPPVVYADARTHFDAALTAGPKTAYAPRAQAGLAACFFFYKDYAGAKAAMDAALAADPENNAFYKPAEKIYRALGLPPPVKIQK